MGFPRDQKYEEAVKLYQKGMSIGEIAGFYQITRQAMWKILQRRGVSFRSNLRFNKQNHFYRGTKAIDRAQNLAEKALEKGILKRPSKCQKCGGEGNSKGIEAHHPDYSKPLEIMWLCQPCHHQWHKEHIAKGSH